MLLFPGLSTSQGFDIIMTVEPTPSALIRDWESVPAIAVVQVFSELVQSQEIRVVISATEAELGLTVTAKSPLFLIAQGTGFQVYDNRDFFKWDEVDYAPEVENRMVSNGRFPDGIYQLCAEVQTPTGEVLARTCTSFNTIFADQTILLFPENEATVLTGSPLFQWTPVTWTAALFYRFELAEVFDNQPPYEALESNLIYYEALLPGQTSLIYPLTAPELELGKRYAWRIQSLDAAGLPLGINEGISEVFTFNYSPVPGASTLHLLFPKNGETVNNSFPVFSWQCLDGCGQARFDLFVWELPAGLSSPTPGLLDTLPVFMEVEKIPAAHFASILENRPLRPGWCYAWRVSRSAATRQSEYPIGFFCAAQALTFQRTLSPTLPETVDFLADAGVGSLFFTQKCPSPPLQRQAAGYSEAVNNQQSKIKLRGSLSARLSAYEASGIATRYEPWTVTFAGAPMLQIGQVNVPIRLLLGNQGRRFGQQFNRFGISPRYKWLRFHLGHNNVHFSPYTLAGRTFLGAGVELNPGKFRFGAVYGRFQNAVEELEDTLLNKQPRIVYERRGYAVKLGYGKAENFIDLLFFKAKDDTTSVSIQNPPAAVSPQENLVLGISTKQQLGKKWSFDLDFAASAFTRNLRSAEQGLEENFWSKLLVAFFTPRYASQYHYAGETGLRYRTKSFGCDLRYRRIDTDYQSMGAFYLNNDLESITLNPNFTAAKNKLRVHASLGWQRNNLADIRANRTFRQIGMLDARYALTPDLQFHLNFSNFSIEQRRRRPLTPDSLLLDQATRNLSGGFQRTVKNYLYSQTIMLSGNYRWLSDRNEGTDNGYRSRGFNIHYSITVLDADLTFSTGLTYDRYKYRRDEFLRVRPLFGFQKQLLKRKANAGAMFAHSLNYKNAEIASIVQTPRIYASYRPAPKHQFSFSANLLRNNTKEAGQPSFTETRGDLSYAVQF